MRQRPNGLESQLAASGSRRPVLCTDDFEFIREHRGAASATKSESSRKFWIDRPAINHFHAVAVDPVHIAGARPEGTPIEAELSEILHAAIISSLWRAWKISASSDMKALRVRTSVVVRLAPHKIAASSLTSARPPQFDAKFFALAQFLNAGTGACVGAMTWSDADRFPVSNFVTEHGHTLAVAHDLAEAVAEALTLSPAEARTLQREQSRRPKKSSGRRVD